MYYKELVTKGTKNKSMMETTLNKIKAHNPSSEKWSKLLRSLGKTKADDEPISIKRIIETNDFEDALWYFCTVDNYSSILRDFARFCGSQNIEKLIPYLNTEEYSLVHKWVDTGDESIKSEVYEITFNLAKTVPLYDVEHAAYAIAWAAQKDVASWVYWVSWVSWASWTSCRAIKASRKILEDQKNYLLETLNDGSDGSDGSMKYEELVTLATQSKSQIYYLLAKYADIVLAKPKSSKEMAYDLGLAPSKFSIIFQTLLAKKLVDEPYHE